MVSWIIQDGRARWVAGVFESRVGAEAHLAQRSDVFRQTAWVGADEAVVFPCWLIEAKSQLTFINNDALAIATGSLRDIEPNEDGVVGILYRFTSEYIPEAIEEDRMGSIAHHHLEVVDLDEIESGGFKWFNDTPPGGWAAWVDGEEE